MKTLVVAPHPDDEILGCGGTLLRRKAEGGVIGWMIVTTADGFAAWSDEQKARRVAEINAVTAAIGFDVVFELRLPTTRVDALDTADVVAKVSEVFLTFAPEEVLVPHRGDVHSDHRATFDAVVACAKWFRYPSVSRMLAYETVSETEFGLSRETAFVPNVYVDISAHLDRKLEILQTYRSEIHEFPFPRSVRAVRALAEWRGSSAGFAAAEAFELLRERR